MNLSIIDWQAVQGSLNSTGYASLGTLLDPAQCLQLIELYGESARFRTRIEMQRYRFGVGEYQYFSYPLPPLVESLRGGLYSPLARIANEWMQALKAEVVYPKDHSEFLHRCDLAGQARPTPLLLTYPPGGFNCLHQDLYGDVYFPFQVILQLTRPETDFTGGHLLLVEQRPRAQSIGNVLSPGQGEAFVIPTRYRPVSGTSRTYRGNLRHGVSRVHSGRRWTLGIIFHDAREA